MTPAATIFAVSSGSPPAAIAVVRISGPQADSALAALTGLAPEPRRAAMAAVRDPATAELLDNGLALRFPGPRSATGEDLAELHLHGGRSVVAGVLGALERLPGLRPARPGEFTRRAFENGRIDLAEAEGLADLLAAETDAQRRAALTLAGGGLSRQVEAWQQTLLSLSARVEAALDFGDEADVGEALPQEWDADLDALAAELSSWVKRPAAERLKDGIRVVIAGPPNAGKSSLINALAGREAAITAAVPGTTRDLVEVPAAIDGLPFLLVDTAGLRDSHDEVETIGIERAKGAIANADIVLWLGEAAERPLNVASILVQSKIDLGRSCDEAEVRVSSVTGEGLADLVATVQSRASKLLPREGEVAIHARHRALLQEALAELQAASHTADLLLRAESLRLARASIDRITGRAGIEEMLDALFGRFCIGK